MRLFFYYAIHSFLNTLKKLLKTWVAVFLVIGLGGALIGGIIGLVASAVVKDDEPEQKIEMTDPEEETPEDDKEKTCDQRRERQIVGKDIPAG